MLPAVSQRRPLIGWDEPWDGASTIVRRCWTCFCRTFVTHYAAFAPVPASRWWWCSGSGSGSQIEVNQRFPLRFPEKRPFFYEGGQFFQSPGALSFVDTRQIVDPDWGAKLTGKTGANTVGVLTSSDRAPGLRAAPGANGFEDNAAIVEGVNFDPGRPMVGNALDTSVTITAKPIAALDSEFLLLNSQLNAQRGDAAGLGRWRHPVSTADLSQPDELSVHPCPRVAIDCRVNTFSRQFSLSLLYGWTPRPTTALYFGYGDLLDRDPIAGDGHRLGNELRRVRRTLFVKASYGLSR